MKKTKQNQIYPTLDIAELIDELIKTRIAEEQGVVFNSDRVELLKGAIVDYLLVTGPRAGVFVNRETKRS